jgi:hypothetical protein
MLSAAFSLPNSFSALFQFIVAHQFIIFLIALTRLFLRGPQAHERMLSVTAVAVTPALLKPFDTLHCAQNDTFFILEYFASLLRQS